MLCQCIHTNTRIFTLFEDSEPTGLKVDTTVGVTVSDSDLCCGVFDVIRAPINPLVCFCCCRLTMAVTWTLVTLYADGDRKGWGEMYLYFGCRRNDVDNIYRDELSQMKKEKVLTDYFVALSREPGQPKVMQPRVCVGRDGGGGGGGGRGTCVCVCVCVCMCVDGFVVCLSVCARVVVVCVGVGGCVRACASLRTCLPPSIQYQ